MAYRRDEPIITSLMDVDFYKFTMGHVIHQLYPKVQATFGLTNRTKSVSLVDTIDEGHLREELDHVRTLRFTNSELHYLRGTNEYGERMFKEDYLQFLKILEIPNYTLDKKEGQYRLEFPGTWMTSTYWETIALSIINELYYRSTMNEMSRFTRDRLFAEGRVRLDEKIKKLRTYPELTFMEFGTRRRFSRQWQYYVTEVMSEELPRQFLGTSNTKAADIYGLLPMGTSAHEMYMVLAAILGETNEGLLASHNQQLQDWWSVYGWGLSIALTDTFGTDFFFNDMTEEQSHNWKGLRHDSGDPFVFGEQAITFYEGYGIDPKEKLLVFSDGLDVETMIDIYCHFYGRIRVTFGWGTNLTNDLGLPALSLVIKAIMANGRPTVKLSDNIAKAMSIEETEIDRYKKVFGHTVTHEEVCVY